MARRPAVLITGANGEVGHGLIEALAARGDCDVVAVDLHPLAKSLRPLVVNWQAGDILDEQLMQRLVTEYEVTTLFHLAALLTRAEYSPDIAHEVNVTGTLHLLNGAPAKQLEWSPDKVYLPVLHRCLWYSEFGGKGGVATLKEWEQLAPTTMYGCNKVYCEHLGRYYAQHYQQLAALPSGVGWTFEASGSRG